ncbi:MAG: dynamin family protein [Clostridiaceae bacterium]
MSNNIDESILNRITINFNDVSKNINLILDELMSIKYDNKIQLAVGSEFIKKLVNCDLTIKQRLKDDLSIVVIGDFKRGKSTLINALLREKIMPTNVTPETVTFNAISYGETKKIEAVLSDGRRAKLELSELKKDNLKKLMGHLPSEIEYIDIKMPINILKGIRIIDTPGVGDLLNKFDNSINKFMINADVVIYVVSALSPLSITEQNFLCASILPQNFSNLFLVLNMVDCLENENEVEKIKSLINIKLSNIFTNSYVYAVSGLDEFCRRKNLKRPNENLNEILEKSFDDMYDSLENNVFFKKDIIQTQRCVNMLKFMINEIEGRITLINNMILLNKNKLNDLTNQYKNENSNLLKNINKHKEEVKLEIRDMKSEAIQWMTEFLTRLENEILENDDKSLEVLEKFFHFYIIDIVRSAIIECTTIHLKNISLLLKNTSEVFEEEFLDFNLSYSSKEIANSFVDISWTNMDAAAVALNFIPGLGALTLLGQAIIGFAKQKNTSELQKKYIINILDNFDQIKVNILLEVSNIYENIISFSEEQLDKIYDIQIEASLQAINQAKIISTKEDLEKKDLKLGLESATLIINSAKDKINKFNNWRL